MSPTQQKEDSVGGILLIGHDSSGGRQTAKFLEQLGYKVLGEVPDNAEVEMVVIAAGASLDAQAPLEAGQGEYPPPLVVFGPANGEAWRREALEAGAFACLSWEAPREERASLLAAASRFRAAQREIQIVRRESDYVLTRLLT
ncbi:MAG: hypothetical protein GY953_26310, partial [bacterium]|nr:hypothetical protein [bacterium]